MHISRMNPSIQTCACRAGSVAGIGCTHSLLQLHTEPSQARTKVLVNVIILAVAKISRYVLHNFEENLF